MSLKSMTGFARASGVVTGWQWSWEIKSVNAKGLDSRVRVPSILDGLDIEVKKIISKDIKRGTVYANLDIKQNKVDGDGNSSLAVNRENLEEVFDLLQEYESTAELAPSSMAQLLSIKGILEVEEAGVSENLRKNLEVGVLRGFEGVLTALIKAREDEGKAMHLVINEHITSLDFMLEKAADCDAVRMENVRDRFKEKVESLLVDNEGLSDERLEQEVAVLAVKADISEEINRLKAHLKSARDMLKSKNPVGRQYDFLAQELNREVNTLCSKSSDIELTKIGLEMKAQVDMLREQIQNIE
ncbi:MAG: YicC family protein [Sphingomonadales bacterium]|nr:YicC family protein [Sphingomonadales bacterium]